MATSGSNELNMLLKARVVKIKVELDIKGSGLVGQVNNITKFLSDKRVKLKVELQTTGLSSELQKINNSLKDKKVKIGVELNYNAKDINKQINQIANTIKQSKTGLSDLKIGVSIDVKGTASKIKGQLAEINKVVQEFNANYAKQIKQMQSQSQNITSGGRPSTSPVVADANAYAKSLKDAQQYMKNQFGKGLFSSNEIKDANGALTGFVGTLTKANGVVQKIRYDWDANAGKFTPINRQTITNTEQSVAKALNSLRDLDREISKLGKNQDKFWQESDALKARSAHGALTQDAVNALKIRIKEEQTLQAQIKNENTLLRQQKELLAQIKREQKNANNSNYKGELSNIKNAVTSVNLDDTMAKSKLTDLRSNLNSLKQSYSDSVRKEKDLTNAVEKRRDVLAEIARIEKTVFLNASSGFGSKRYLEETKALAKNIKTMEQYNKVRERMNSTNRAIKSIKIDNDIEKQMTKLQKAMYGFSEATGKSASVIQSRFEQVAQAVRGNLGLINNEIQRYAKLTEKHKLEQAHALRQQSIVNNPNDRNHKTINNLVSAKDNNAIKEYIANLNGAQVAMMRLTTDSKGISRITAQFASTKKTAKEVVYEIDNVDKKLRQLSTAEVFNANRNLGVFEQLKIAMARVPVWMVAMTAFHGSIQTVKNLTEEILKLDKAMTELRRVADSQIDTEHIFRGALDLSKQLGNNIHDVMASVNDLARTFGHFNERQLLAIANTATLMSNVSDLSAQEATESLVGTMNAFNITAEDSIRIVDAMNEVDNNYAISTKQLATGLAKSASTAKTFGVEMEENIGHITAIGAVTMESGNIIGNSLKTIYSRITTMKGARDVLEGVGISLTDVTGDSREVADIIDDLGNKWNTLSKSQQQNIAVTVAGRYQLSRFLALMNNYKMAQESIHTAYNSQGSAMRENAQYLKSFEARINALKNSFTEMAVSIGDAFLTSGLSVGIEMLTKLAEVTVGVVDTFGILPAILGVVGLALLKFGVFSKAISGMVIGMTSVQHAYRTATVTINGATVATTRLGATSRVAWNSIKAGAVGATTAVRAFGASVWTAMNGLKGAIASTGILAGFLLVGWAIEKLIGHFDKLRREQEEFETTNKKMIDSFRATGDGMQGMISEYETLYNKKQQNIDMTDEESQRLKELTSQFAEQLPTVVDYYDANGEAILQSTDAIREQIKAVSDLSREQARLKDMELSKNIQKEVKSYAEVTEEIEKAKKRIEEMKEASTYRDEYGTEYEIDNTVAIQKETIKLMELESQRRASMSGLTKLIQEQTVAYLEANGQLVGFGDNQQQLIEKFVTYNDKLLITAERNGTLAETSEELVTMTKQVAEVFTDAYDVMSKDLDTSELEALRTQLEAVSASVPEDFLEIDPSKPLQSMNQITTGMKEIINVATHVQAGSEDFNYLSQRLQNAGLSSSQASDMLGRLGAQYSNASIRAEAMRQSVEGTTGAIDDMTQSAIDAVNPIEQLFGYSTDDMGAVKSHIETMELLYQAQGKGAESTSKFMDSQYAVADFFNTTPEMVLENIHTYNLLAEAIGKVKVATDDQGGSYLDLSEATSDLNQKQREMLDAWLKSGGSTSIFTGELLEAKNQVNDTKETYNRAKTEMSEPFKLNVDTSELDSMMQNSIQNSLNINKDARQLLDINASAVNKTLSDVSKSTQSLGQMNTDISGVKKTTDELKDGTIETSGATATAFTSMKDSVNTNTSTMITKHGQQRNALLLLANQASSTNTAISNMNANASKSIESISRYQNKLNGLNGSASNLLNNFASQSIMGNSFSANSPVGESISSFTATVEGATSSGGIGGGEGTSGIIKPSVPTFEALHNTSGSSQYAYKPSTSTSSKTTTKTATKKSNTKTATAQKEIEKTAKELAELYVIDLLDRKRTQYQGTLSQLEAKISGLSKNTHKYRVAMQDAQKYEGIILNINKEDLANTVKRNKEIEKRLSLLSNTKKHTEKQREEYNKLQQEYDTNLSKISQLQGEIESTIVELRKKTEEIFMDFIEDIVGKMDEGIKAISDRVSDADFELEVLELTDPDNNIAKIDLMAQKVRDLTKEQKEYNLAQAELEERIRYATSKFGANSDAVKQLVSQMEQYEQSWRDVTLEIMRTEKEIRELRSEVADELIDSFKKHFENVKKGAEDASQAEIDSAKKAHDAKMKMYDEESKRITDLYDQRIKAIDDAYAKETYQEELAEKNEELAELRKKGEQYAGDTSLEGRKKSAEIQKQIADKQKELNDFVKKHHIDTLKEQLQEEKDMLLEQNENKKQIDQEAHDTMMEQLEAERDRISEHYESITEDEKKWAKIREELMKGNFTVVNQLLQDMGINLEQLSDGTFNTLSEGFNSYSEEVRNFVLEINNMINQINSMTKSAYGSISVPSNPSVSIGEPINPYSVSSLIQKAYSGEALMSPSEDKNQLYKMIQNSGISEYRMSEIWRKAQAGISLDIPSPDHMTFYNMFEEILKSQKLKRFNTGGYTGNNVPSSGAVAILDNKELVLDEKDTSNILDAVKLLDKVKSILPSINRNKVAETFGASGVFNNTTNYELNVNIDKLNGDKSGATLVVKEIMKGLKKLGK